MLQRARNTSSKKHGLKLTILTSMPNAGLDSIHMGQGLCSQNLAVEHSRLMRAIGLAEFRAGFDVRQFGLSGSSTDR